MTATLFAVLCDLVTALEDLERDMPPSVHQYRLHALIHRFDALIDAAASLEWPADEAPANTYEGPLGPEDTSCEP